MGQPQGAGAKQFVMLGGLKEELDDQLEGLGLVPEDLGFEQDRGLPQAGEQSCCRAVSGRTSPTAERARSLSTRARTMRWRESR